MGNYDFDSDLDVAKRTEYQMCAYLQENLSLKFLSSCDTSDWDLEFCNSKSGEVLTFEIKEDFMCEETGNVSVEFKSRGKPSGIMVSKAEWWLYKVHQEDNKIGVYVNRLDELKGMVRQRLFTRKVNGGDRNSNTWNYLFPFDVFTEHFLKLGMVKY